MTDDIRKPWSTVENEAIVADYFAMLIHEINGQDYTKAEHRRRLQSIVQRSNGSLEFKHCNVSAVLVEVGCRYLSGYHPRSQFQHSLRDVVLSRLESDDALHRLLVADADRDTTQPAVENILHSLENPPERGDEPKYVRDAGAPPRYTRVNYAERESQNRSLGLQGELFALRFEQARLESYGRTDLAKKIEHVSVSRGDGDGFDILSFDETGQERYVEVKTTKSGPCTPFFLTRNELRVSQSASERYSLYRVHSFASSPRLFQLHGDVAERCTLTPTVYVASV